MFVLRNTFLVHVLCSVCTSFTGKQRITLNEFTIKGLIVKFFLVDTVNQEISNIKRTNSSCTKLDLQNINNNWFVPYTGITPYINEQTQIMYTTHLMYTIMLIFLFIQLYTGNCQEIQCERQTHQRRFMNNCIQRSKALKF